MDAEQQRKLLYAGAAIFSLLVAIAAFQSPAGAWPLCAMAIACIVAANIDRVREVSASTSGVQVVLNRAREAVDQVTRLIRLNAKAQLALVQRMGRWDSGFSDKERTEVLEENMMLLRDAGVSEPEIRKLKAAVWDPLVHFDYVSAILSGLRQNPLPQESALQIKKMATLDGLPTADELEKFLKDIIILDGLRAELLADYRYYREHGVTARPDVWARRAELETTLVTLRAKAESKA